MSASSVINPPSSPSLRQVQDVVLVEDNSVDRRLIHLCFHESFAPARWREFDMGRAALDACLSDPPDLMLLDLHLPDFHGLELLKMLRQDGHQFAVIVMTSLPEKVEPKALLELHVDGYLDKYTLRAGLPVAVNSVLDGRMFFSASRSPFQKRIKVTAPALPVLSEREKEIARLVTHGFPSKQIADRLNLSVRTVENHRARIMMRLDLVNVADLVRWCIRHGLD
ncbi:MAG: LuxR family transcriptional regulator [Rariglobus sp.]|jgi:DNA-binding NarL/FixJ family response regulator|nr:LuxR family transcriptional regulator [Rariglobus sp.]